MSAQLLFRIASLFMVIHFLGHSVGHLTRKDTTDPVKQEVIRQMSEHQFKLMGTDRSLDNYYEGYSLILFIVFALLISMLWIASSLAVIQSDTAKKMAWSISFALLAVSAIEFKYFFPFAAFISLGAALFTILALVRLQKN